VKLLNLILTLLLFFSFLFFLFSDIIAKQPLGFLVFSFVRYFPLLTFVFFSFWIIRKESFFFPEKLKKFTLVFLIFALLLLLIIIINSSHLKETFSSLIEMAEILFFPLWLLLAIFILFYPKIEHYRWAFSSFLILAFFLSWSFSPGALPNLIDIFRPQVPENLIINPELFKVERLINTWGDSILNETLNQPYPLAFSQDDQWLYFIQSRSLYKIHLKTKKIIPVDFIAQNNINEACILEKDGKVYLTKGEEANGLACRNELSFQKSQPIPEELKNLVSKYKTNYDTYFCLPRPGTNVSLGIVCSTKNCLFPILFLEKNKKFTQLFSSSLGTYPSNFIFSHNGKFLVFFEGSPFSPRDIFLLEFLVIESVEEPFASTFGQDFDNIHFRSEPSKIVFYWMENGEYHESTIWKNNYPLLFRNELHVQRLNINQKSSLFLLTSEVPGNAGNLFQLYGLIYNPVKNQVLYETKGRFLEGRYQTIKVNEKSDVALNFYWSYYDYCNSCGYPLKEYLGWDEKTQTFKTKNTSYQSEFQSLLEEWEKLNKCFVNGQSLTFEQISQLYGKDTSCQPSDPNAVMTEGITPEEYFELTKIIKDITRRVEKSVL